MGDWETMALSSLQLTTPEHRYYGDIFIYCCENADTDLVPTAKVGKLLRSANLPSEVTLQILDICGGAKSNTLNRKQFYAALKLVAAHQAGLEVHKDLICASVDELALPKFTWPSSTGDEEEGNKKRFSKKSSKIRSGHMPESTTESESEAESPRETEGGSTDSPTPTNSVIQERNDGALGGEANLDSVTGGWQSLLVSEEQRQLLGTEEESSERHSSDDGEGEDGESFPPEQVWTISEEQREYYAAQFAQLQPNPEGLLAGSLARKFFEKSRLPVEELRRIWQLADVTRDSALSLQEFYVAMHLAVLRRNHVPLPDVLPPSLAMLIVTPQTSTVPIVAPQVPPPVQQAPPPPQPAVVPPVPAPRGSPTARAAAAAAAAVHSAHNVGGKDKSKEWTKFVDSPTGTSAGNNNGGGNSGSGGSNGGSLTSPGPKPVNFDFQKAALERDPKILHPVPLRLTPEAAILASNANGNNGVVPILGDDDLSLTSGLVQRPLAKKPGGLPLPDETVIATPKKEPPPPPPPRPYRTHTRSSSLDLNKLGKNGQTFLGAPPTVPPRVSPGITTSTTRKLVGQKSEGEGPRIHNDEPGFIADFSQFAPRTEESQTVENNVPPSQQFTGVYGAFHIYKKPSNRRGSGQEEMTKDETDEISKKLTLQELREKNAELRQVCEELTRELAGALQERINLRAKLLLLT
ncbi:ralBP1-associated Eps domain-containing protein 2 isoform X1 [Nasonia vitripennis]|uniref:RalBP1-associated Eps domain-containing protein 1 n=1 Tax=Nasonia vitripennis TaxID=7425 RepID=A0A7M7Q6Q1_NASVI|nr:ralBP1-associated Eps domain-containing protein 2 isoform X1 [Nasonia vitripennis]